MHASTATWPLLLPLLLGAAAAKPALYPRAPDATDLWVTVDESGHPKTVTPIQTTISGTPTVISAAPNAVTATVFTTTNNGDVRTSTATAANPTPTATGGAGAFPVCHNNDGDNAPFCLPAPGAVLNPGKSYYITWDPTYFPSSNTTVKITGSFFNTTTGEVTSQAFSSGALAAAWSFYTWTIDSAFLSSAPGGANVSLTIAALTPGSSAMTPLQGPVVLVAKPATYKPAHAKAPSGPALYIGLPTVLGFVVVVLVGTCWWNRHHRRIDIGNVMGRGRGGYGVGKSRRQRVFGGAGAGRRAERKEAAIRLMERDGGGAAEDAAAVYRDEVDEEEGRAGGRRPPQQRPRVVTSPEDRRADGEFDFGIPRRDSDALGSLAGSPTEDRHPDGFGRAPASAPGKGPSGNAFRDELSRQERERF